MKVPFIDMQARHAPLRDEILRAIAAVIDSGNFTGESAVEGFEDEFAAYCGVRHAVAVGNGTEALWLALTAMGIGPGDEVITVPMTFMATIEAIRLSGATPVFADIDAHSYTLNPAALAAAFTPRTRAIVPVHLFGQIAAMEPILAFAAKHGLAVIEDAAQAHGAQFGGRMAGAFGHAGCFSFYPAKNLGAMGEAGAIITDDGGLATRLRTLRNHGQTHKNHHTVMGWNCRMDAIQAAVLRVKLRHLDGDNHRRRLHARAYATALAGLPGLTLPAAAEPLAHVHHIHAVRVPERDHVIQCLTRHGIGCAIHYPVPAHLQGACADLACRPGDFPVAETCAHEFLSLPMYPELQAVQLDHVVRAMEAALDNRVAA